MNEVLYECRECGKTFIFKKAKDGLNCDKCKGSLAPLDYVDVVKNRITRMQDKIAKADKQYPLNKVANTKSLTVKLDLDTTEFEESLNRIEKQLERIKHLKDALKFDKDLDKVKNVTINNNVDMEELAKTLRDIAVSMCLRRSDIDGTA